MKKTYIEPATKIVSVKSERILGAVSGEGISVGISNSAATYDAESRGGGSWDDED